MWGQPKKVENAPQAMLDFISALALAIKDPTVLEPMVKAAQEISTANALTEEQIAEVEKAKKIIDDAVEIQKSINKKNQDLVVFQGQLQQKAVDVGNRERQADERNSAHAGKETALGAREAGLNAREVAIASREAIARAVDEQNLNLAASLALREQRVADNEKTLNTALNSFKKTG